MPYENADRIKRNQNSRPHYVNSYNSVIVSGTFSDVQLTHHYTFFSYVTVSSARSKNRK